MSQDVILTMNEEIQMTMGFWIESRIDGRSASMCINAEYVNLDLLKAFDKVTGTMIAAGLSRKGNSMSDKLSDYIYQHKCKKCEITEYVESKYYFDRHCIIRCDCNTIMNYTGARLAIAHRVDLDGGVT